MSSSCGLAATAAAAVLSYPHYFHNHCTELLRALIVWRQTCKRCSEYWGVIILVEGTFFIVIEVVS